MTALCLLLVVLLIATCWYIRMLCRRLASQRIELSDYLERVEAARQHADAAHRRTQEFIRQRDRYCAEAHDQRTTALWWANRFARLQLEVKTSIALRSGGPRGQA